MRYKWLQLKYPVVYVEWVDAETEGGWEEEKEIGKLPVCATLGFLVKETEDTIVVASTYESTHTNARIKIPRAWLKSYTVLKVTGI